MLSFGIIKTVCIQIFALSHPTGVFFVFAEILKNARGIWFLGDLAVNTILVLIALHFCSGKFQHDCKYFLMMLPLTLIPVITYKSPHMYLFFVIGFWTASYLTKDFLVKIASYWKIVAGIFVVAYFSFSYMPWPPEDFQYNFHEQSFIRLAVNDGLKFILGLSGSFLSLALIHKYLPFLQSTWIFRRAAQEGRFTLDIYLLQVIIIEILGSHLYKIWLYYGHIDIFYIGGVSAV